MYPTPSSARDKNVVVVRQNDQSSTDLAPPPASVNTVDSAAVVSFNGTNTDALGQDGLPFSWSSGNSSCSSPDSWQEELAVSAPLLLDDVPLEEPLQLGRTLLPELTVPVYLNEGQVQYVARALRSFVSSLAYTGSTPFLHQTLWRAYQPEAYQDSVSLSALYLCKTSANSALITNTINYKIARLIANSRTWSLPEHLAAVQTMIIYQIMRLFDPSLNDQDQAQKHNLLLDAWAAQLWKRSFIEPTVLANCHDTWVFNESLRRTVLMAVFIRCAWSTYTRCGLASQVSVLARIPFTKDAQAWKAQPEEWNSTILPQLLETDNLTVYTDFTDVWKSDDELQTLDPFGKLLLAASRGDDDPRLLG